MLKKRLRPLNYYSLAFAIVVIIGETLVMLNTSKPFPLSADDYLAALALLLFSIRPLTTQRLAGLLATWCFAVGGLWVMLIYRIDPALGGNGERVFVLGGAFVAACIGALWTARTRELK